MLSVDEQMHIIKSGVHEIIPEQELRKKLEKGKPLNIKLGVDPTAPDMHLGHAVPLNKMRQMQDLGHRVTLIIGNGTALIGDPSGRNSTRPPLTSEEIAFNAKTYIEQAFKVLDESKTDLVYNADWLLKMNLKDLLELTSNFTVARILERDDFSNRYNNQQSISLHEFLYPTLQAYDSVQIKADIEMGGTDQLFNLLAGRDLMSAKGMEPQVCITMPLLEGTDGVKKMSKSYKNYIGLTDEPNDMFGKVMSIPDEMIVKYYRLASNVSVDEIDKIEQGLADESLHPNKVKRALAQNIVTRYYDGKAAAEAEEAFDSLFKAHEIPDDVEEFALDLNGEVYLPGIINEAGLAKSGGEARRLIDGGGVKLDGVPVEKGTYNVDGSTLADKVLQVGKRNFVKLINK